MNRRTFLAAIGGAVAWPRAMFAQSAKMPLIGFLDSGSRAGMTELLAGFHQGLDEMGFTEGKTVAFEYRWANARYDQLPDLALELVRRPVTIIVATRGPAPGRAAKAATATIPIIFQSGAGGLVVGADFFLVSRRDKLTQLAARQRLPTIYPLREFATAGGLLSYGTDLAEGYRSLGLYAGRILMGEKPADLRVQQSTKIELVINLKTAKALDLDIPPSLLARADEVIE